MTIDVFKCISCRYTLEYEHVRFLGRGGFGVVFEAINTLDERRVAIKRVSLKK
jgi:serine/threonine protein kinase